MLIKETSVVNRFFNRISEAFILLLITLSAKQHVV
jgi:hypothetical protein